MLIIQGIILATASSGSTPEGMFWMMIITRGIAGVGAGGEYAVCTAQVSSLFVHLKPNQIYCNNAPKLTSARLSNPQM